MTQKNKEYYMSLDWKYIFQKSPDGGYFARIKGLKCHSYGEDMIQASKNILEALESYIEASLEENIIIPEPLKEDKYTGRLSLRVSKSLHCILANIAQEENVSISHLINDALVKQYRGA